MKPKYSFFLPFFLFACKNSGVGTNKNDNPETQFLGQLTEVNRRNGTQSDFNELANNFKGSFSLPNYLSIFRKICDVGYTNEPETLLYVCTAWMNNGSIDKFEVQHIFRDLCKTHEDNYRKFFEYIKRLNFDEQNPNAQSLIDLLSKTGTKAIPHISLQAIGVPPIAKTEIIPDAITIDNIQDFGQWVRFINQKHEIDIKDWNKGNELISKFSINGPKLFNESVCLINTNVVSKCSGNDIVGSISKQVQLTNDSLKAISSFIPDDRVVDSDDLQSLLSLCTQISEFNPLFQKCDKKIIDVAVLEKLIDCKKNNLGGFDEVLQRIDADCFSTTCIGNDVLDTIIKVSNVRFCKDSCDKIFGMIQGGKEIDKAEEFIDFLVNHVKTDVSSLDFGVNKYAGGAFNINCLTKLCSYTGSFNNVINKVNKFAKCQGDDVIAQFVGKNIELDDKSLSKILKMIPYKQKITKNNAANLMKFIVKNLANVEKIDTVFTKYVGGKFNINCLTKLCTTHTDSFAKVIGQISDSKFATNCSGDNVIAQFVDKNIELDDTNLPKILKMIAAGQKITVANAANLMKFIVDNLVNVDKIDAVFGKYENDAFDLDCLTELCTTHTDSFAKVIGKISDDKFVTDCKGDDVIAQIVGKNIKLDDTNLPKILKMINDGDKITEVNNLSKFLLANIQDGNSNSYKSVLDLYTFNGGANVGDNCTGKVSLELLGKFTVNDDVFKIVESIPDECFKFDVGNKGWPINTVFGKLGNVQLNATTWKKISSMIVDNSVVENWDVFTKALVTNFANFTDLSPVIDKINGKKVGTDFLGALAQVSGNKQAIASKVFCNVLSKIYSFGDNLDENIVLNCFSGKKVKLDSKTFDTVTKMCKKDSTTRNYKTLNNFFKNNIGKDIDFDKLANFFSSAYVTNDSFKENDLNFVLQDLSKYNGFSFEKIFKDINLEVFCQSILGDFSCFLVLNRMTQSYLPNNLFVSWVNSDQLAFSKITRMCKNIPMNNSNDITSLPIRFLWFLTVYFDKLSDDNRKEFIDKASRNLLGNFGKKVNNRKIIFDKIKNEFNTLYTDLNSKGII